MLVEFDSEFSLEARAKELSDRSLCMWKVRDSLK